MILRASGKLLKSENVITLYFDAEFKGKKQNYLLEIADDEAITLCLLSEH
jgi:hypothetical protein